MLRSQWSIKTHFLTLQLLELVLKIPSLHKHLIQSLINGGESATLSLAQVTPGQYDYHCMVHPYMTGKIDCSVRAIINISMQLLKASHLLLFAVLFSLIFIGGYVSALAWVSPCPDWPLCPQGLVPHEDFIIEYFHRSVAATTGMLVIATMAFTLKSKDAPRGMKIASLIAMLVQ